MRLFILLLTTLVMGAVLAGPAAASLDDYEIGFDTKVDDATSEVTFRVIWDYDDTTSQATATLTRLEKGKPVVMASKAGIVRGVNSAGGLSDTAFDVKLQPDAASKKLLKKAGKIAATLSVTWANPGQPPIVTRTQKVDFEAITVCSPKTFKIPNANVFGGVTVTDLKLSGFSACSTARGVAAAFSACEYTATKLGGCKRTTFNGFKCFTQRAPLEQSTGEGDDDMPIEIGLEGSAECAKGVQKFSFSTAALYFPKAKPSRTTTACTPPAAFPEAGGSFTSLAASKGVTCATATAVAKAYATCATANGKGGRCVKKVRGYACREEAFTAGGVRTTTATCTSGTKTVSVGTERRV